MATLKIELSPPAKSFLDNQIATGECDDAGKFISKVLEAEQRRRAEAKLLKLVEEAEASGPPTPWTKEDVQQMKAEIRKGLAERRTSRRQKVKQKQ